MKLRGQPICWICTKDLKDQEGREGDGSPNMLGKHGAPSRRSTQTHPPMIPPTFNTAKERQEYHASLPVPEKRNWIEREFEKERRAQIRRNERESARKVAFLKDLYRRKEEQEAAEQVKAMVERNARAAALLKRTRGYVPTVPFRGQPATNRAICEAQ